MQRDLLVDMVEEVENSSLRESASEQSVQNYEAATRTGLQEDVMQTTAQNMVINAVNSSVSITPSSMYPGVYENILHHTNARINHTDWSKFVETDAFTAAEIKLKHFGVVVITGRPGVGKSMLGLNLLQKSKRKKVILTYPHDWYTLPLCEEKLIVMVDNIFGYSQIDSYLKEQWLIMFDMIWPQINFGRVKFIILFRADMYDMCKEQLSSFEIFRSLHIVSLSERKYQLSCDQRIKIATVHMQKTKSKIDHNELRHVVGNLTCLPFPRVCQIYEKCRTAQNRGIEYFRNPVECLIKEVAILKEQNTIQYFLLVLVMVLKGQLPQSFFYGSEETLPIMTQVRKFVHFKFDNSVSFESVANGMVGTFLSCSADGIYRFLHPVIHDSVLLSFSEFHLKDIIDICPVRFLVQYTRIPSCSHMDGTTAGQVLLRDCGILAKRIAVELIEGDFGIILSHPALEDKQFVDILTQKVLNTEGCQKICWRKLRFCSLRKTGPFSVASTYDSRIFLAPEFISSSLFEDSERYICNYKTLICLIVLKDLHYLSKMIISLTSDTFFDLRLLKCCCFMGHIDGVKKLLPNLLCSVKDYSCYQAYVDMFLPCIISKRENKRLMKILLKWWQRNLGYDTCYWFSSRRRNFWFSCHLLEDSARMALAFMKYKYLQSFLSCLKRKGNYRNLLNDLLHQLLVQFHFHLHANVEKEDGTKRGMITDVIRLLHQEGATGYPEKMIFMAAQHQTSETLQVLLETKPGVNYTLGSESTVSKRRKPKDNLQGLIDQLDSLYSVRGRTPLLEASFRNIDSVKMLVENGADVNATDQSGYTILHSPTVYSHHTVLQSILSRKRNTLDDNEKSPLHMACEHGNFQCLSMVLEKYNNVNSVAGGSTALHIALLSSLDKCDKVDAILRAGADVTASDDDGNSPLHLAAVGNRVNIVSKLIELGADINKKNKRGNTPLHIALSLSSTKESLDILLDKGADVLIENNHGITPLYEAVVLTSIDILKKLLRQCPNNSPQFSELKVNPLIACRDAEKIKLLINHGFYITTEDAQNCLEALADAKNDDAINGVSDCIDCVNDKEIQTNYVFCETVETNTARQDGVLDEVINMICEKGANVNSVNADDFTPLQLAVNSSNIKMVEILSMKVANLNAALPLTPYDFGPGVFPVSFHIWQFLLKKGWRPDNSVLQCVARRRFSKTLKLLLEKGYSINSLSEKGNTALHNSLHTWRCLKLLVDNNADVNIQDRNGCTALHLLAATDRGKDKLNLLLQNSADPNITDEDGNTPLLTACRRSCIFKKERDKRSKVKAMKRIVHEKTVTEFETKRKEKVPRDSLDGIDENIKVLLENNADSSVRNKEGITALHLAANQCNYTLMHILLSRGCSSNVTDAHGNTPLNLLLREKIQEQIKKETSKRLQVSQNGDGSHIRGNTYTSDQEVVYSRQDISILTKPINVGKSELWKMVMELLHHEADPDIKNQYEEAPLHYAAVMDCLRTVELLLQADADPDVEDANSRTPLHRVAQCGHTRTARALLDSECNVNKSNNTGDTSLHVAVRNMKYNLVKLLVEKGADLTKRNDNGETAFDLCLNLEHTSNHCWWIHKGQKLLKMLTPKQVPGSCF